MFGIKKKSNFDKLQSVGESNNVRNRDVHAEQQMERSEIGEKKSMTSRIVLISIITVLVAAMVWFLLSLFEAGMDRASTTSFFDVFKHDDATSIHYQTDLRLDGMDGSLEYIPATIFPGYASPRKLGASVDAGAQPSAEDFWSMANIDYEEKINYVDFLNKFFRPSDDESSSYIGRYNGLGYTKLNVWDVYMDVTVNLHWTGYVSLFDSTIGSVMAYQEVDPAEGRPERVDASATVAPPVDAQVEPNPVGPSTAVDPSVTAPETNPGTDPGLTQEPSPGASDGLTESNLGTDSDVSQPELVVPTQPSQPDTPGEIEGKNYFLSFPLWKVFWTLFISGAVWGFGYLMMKKNLDAQNQLEDVSALNQYTNDQHIQFPEESMRMYDWFPDVGAHCDVQVSSMLSHVMVRNKGLKKVEVAKRAEKDIMGKDGEVEYLKGEILLDADGQPIYELMPIIDEKFADALFDSASVVEDKERRTRYVVTDIPYNPPSDDSPDGKYRDKLPGAETVADMINKYWTLPYYEPQRPAGAYLVDTAPSNTIKGVYNVTNA